MAQDMQFMRESPFWYFFARRNLERSAQSLARVLESLQHRATELSLPIHYPWEHASAWAVLLQLFEVVLRQSVYSRLAGYEDLNDAVRVSADPTFRLIGSKRNWDRGAALTSTLHGFETEMLASEENLLGLMAVNRCST